jgi:hypothetical protein
MPANVAEKWASMAGRTRDNGIGASRLEQRIQTFLRDLVGFAIGHD